MTLKKRNILLGFLLFNKITISQGGKQVQKYNYKDIVKKLYNIFNSSFQTDYKIIYQSREEAEALNPNMNNISKSAGGTYQPQNKSIYIFSNVIDEINQRNYNNPNNFYDNGLAFLINACFHELEHRLQFEYPQKLKKQTSFSRVMYDIEKIIMLFDKEFYRQEHDNFYTEIDADSKGVNNAINFLNFCGIDSVNTEYYDALITYNKYRALNYDIPQFISRFNNIVKTYPEILKDKRYISNEQILNFYDEKGCFKSIDELIKNTNVLTSYIISSEMFLKSIDKKTISPKQRKFVLNNINLVFNEHKAKKHILKQMHPQAKTAIEEIDKYTHVARTPSRRTVEFMANENYYQFLENSIKSFSNIVLEDDEQEL